MDSNDKVSEIKVPSNRLRRKGMACTISKQQFCNSDIDINGQSNRKATKQRKTSLPDYFPTSDPLILAKKTSFCQIIEETEIESDSENEINYTEENSERLDKFEHYKSNIELSRCPKVEAKQRSHSVAVNVFNNTYDTDEEDEDVEFVGVRDEILLIKSQFDKLISVLNFDTSCTLPGLPDSESPKE